MDDRITYLTNPVVPDWYCILNLGRHSHLGLVLQPVIGPNSFSISENDFPLTTSWIGSSLKVWFGESPSDMDSSVKDPIIVITRFHCDHAISDCERPVSSGVFGISEGFFGANVPFPSQKLRKPMQRCLSCVAYLADGSHSGRRIEQFSMLMGVYSTYQWELIVYLKMGVSYKTPAKI